MQKTQLNVYLPPDLLKALKALAKKERRSLSSMATILIEDELKRMKAK